VSHGRDGKGASGHHVRMPRTGAACHGSFAGGRGPSKALPKVPLRSQDGRMTPPSRASSLLTALVVVGAIAATAAPARADVWSAFKGKIFVSDTEFGTGYPT